MHPSHLAGGWSVRPAAGGNGYDVTDSIGLVVGGPFETGLHAISAALAAQVRPVGRRPPASPAPDKGPARRRMLPWEAACSREAIRAVGPVRNRIEGLQAEAAWLIAVGNKAGAHRASDLPYLVRAQALRVQIDALRQELKSSADRERPEIVRHSRFQDAVRAVESLHRMASRALQLLAAPTLRHGVGGRSPR